MIGLSNNNNVFSGRLPDVREKYPIMFTQWSGSAFQAEMRSFVFMEKTPGVTKVHCNGPPNVAIPEEHRWF
jgi:hypothetical protein